MRTKLAMRNIIMRNTYSFAPSSSRFYINEIIITYICSWNLVREVIVITVWIWPEILAIWIIFLLLCLHVHMVWQILNIWIHERHCFLPYIIHLCRNYTGIGLCIQTLLLLLQINVFVAGYFTVHIIQASFIISHFICFCILIISLNHKHKISMHL